MKINNEEICTRCNRKWQLAANIRPLSVRTWTEDGKEITNCKYVCSCGHSWERTEAKGETL